MLSTSMTTGKKNKRNYLDAALKFAKYFYIYIFLVPPTCGRHMIAIRCKRHYHVTEGYAYFIH